MKPLLSKIQNYYTQTGINPLHTDCPTKEKLGQSEPNHFMAYSVMYNKDVNML